MMTEEYFGFLKNKIIITENKGFEADHSLFHHEIKPHQYDSVKWACRKGSALISCSFGLGKTRINIEILKQIINQFPDKPVLVVCPLGVRPQFTHKDGTKLGVNFKYIRNSSEQTLDTLYHITNYERVRDGDINTSIYSCVALDEGSVLRSLGSDTTQKFIHKFRNTQFKFVFTATPAPNEYLELVNYADFLGVMDRGHALTRFFKRNSQKAGNLTIHPKHEDDFWLWVSSWALFITKPSDLNFEYSDEGYILPKLNVNYHMVESDHSLLNIVDRDGQTKLVADVNGSSSEASKIKKASLNNRMLKASELMKNKPNDHFILWHLQENEREWIEKNLPSVVTVYGNQDLDLREKYILDFEDGNIKDIASKPEITGSGCNWQYHCNNAIYASVNYKFNDFIQSIHRIYRFLQDKEVNIDIIYSREEQPVITALKRKWTQHNKLQDKMRDIIRKYGLNHNEMINSISRSFGVKRQELKTNYYNAINNDSVLELQNIESNSIGLIHTSIPFGNHYEYSASYHDFGHNITNDVFWKQMDFLIPQLYRILKPGRCAIIHVKDRIRYSTMTGAGAYTTDSFSDECISAFQKHGFLRLGGGRITIVTDVVRENNQTYRLGWTEKCKDASKMGCGLPEYLLLLRKPQTDLSKGFADEPVMKSKSEFTRAKWQILANSFWKSSGNRIFSPEDISGMDMNTIYNWFKAYCNKEIYDYHFHHKIGELMDEKDKLPSSYGMLLPDTFSDYVWTDINYMKGLNAEQARNNEEQHICPLPFDIVERTIDNWSMEGDIVLDPFGGLMTVPLMAMRMKRYGVGIELNADYWKWGCGYLKSEESKLNIPTLFDFTTE